MPRRGHRTAESHARRLEIRSCQDRIALIRQGRCSCPPWQRCECGAFTATADSTTEGIVPPRIQQLGPAWTAPRRHHRQGRDEPPAPRPNHQALRALEKKDSAVETRGRRSKGHTPPTLQAEQRHPKESIAAATAKGHNLRGAHLAPLPRPLTRRLEAGPAGTPRPQRRRAARQRSRSTRRHDRSPAKRDATDKAGPTQSNPSSHTQNEQWVKAMEGLYRRVNPAKLPQVSAMLRRPL